MTKTCIVTGGSSGIGLSIIELFIANGYQVFNLDIQSSPVGIFKQCDMTNVKQVTNIINNIGILFAVIV